MAARPGIAIVLTVVLAGCVATPATPASAPPSPTATTSSVAPPGPTQARSASPSPSAGAIKLAKASVPRGDASDADARSAAEAINAFAFDLYSELAVGDDNLVFSPASIAIALGMARAGARGATAAEMDEVLHEVASDDHAPWLNALDQALGDRSGTFPDAGNVERSILLRIANSYFAQDGLQLAAEFLQALASGFDAGVHLVDFNHDTEAARQLINGWVSDQTEERIPELLLPPDVRTSTRLVLVNAVYLKAPWFEPFSPQSTAQGDFLRPDGSTVSAPLMHHSTRLPCADGDGWSAVELPYVGEQLAMLVIVPDDLGDFESGLDAERAAAIVGALQDKGAISEITLPRFGIETRAELPDVLMALGMPTAFNDAADFSGISRETRLSISEVIHQANIDVDETGTEAAAATAVGMDSSGGPPCTVSADRPFLFALRDVETGAIVFLGRVTDPTAG